MLPKRDVVSRAAAVALAVIALAACQSTSGGLFDKPLLSRPLFAKAPPDPKTQLPALEARIYELISVQRHVIDPNAKDLALDSELVDIARRRSEDMAAKNSFADGDPRDVSATRLMDKDAQFQGLLGENIAAQHYNARGIDVESFAHRFVETWLASASHKENLSFADYNRTGIGAAISGDTVYVTELFATDLGLGPHKDGTPAPQVTPFASPTAAKAAGPGTASRGPIAGGHSER
jgi:uncharacterized protein YkwD